MDGHRTRIDPEALTGGRVVICYGQTEITRDLMKARAAAALPTFYEAQNVQLHDVTTVSISATFEQNGESYRLRCD